MELALFLLIIFSTNLIQGITGFAGTVLAMPFAIMIYGIDVAKPSLTILALLAGLLIAVRGYRHIVWKEFFKILVVMFIGVFIGDYIYSFLKTELLLQIFSVFVIAVALMGLLGKKNRELPDLALDLILLLAGVIHGMFVSGGPLLIVYAVKKLPEKNQFRTTVSMIWVALDIYLIIKQAMAGLMTNFTLSVTLWSVPALLIGVFIGNRMAAKMSQEAFLKLSYILLIISGVSLLV